MWQRASGFCADDYFSEATLGLYDPDELGSILDDDGNILDANHVELPQGFGPQGSNGAAGEGPVEDASPDDRWRTQLRWNALPPEEHELFRERWKQASIPGAPWRYPAAKQGLVESVLRGVEQEAKRRAGYDSTGGPDAFAENVLYPAAVNLLLTLTGHPTGRAASGEAASVDGDQAGRPVAPPEPPDAVSAAEPADGAATGDVADETPALPLDGATGGIVVPAGVNAMSDGEKVDWAIATVKAMKLADVDSALRQYGQATDGQPNDRRRRLAEQVVERDLGVKGGGS